MDKLCKYEKLKIDALEGKPKQATTKNQKLSKEISLLRKMFEYTKEEKRKDTANSTEVIMSLKGQLQKV